jgi:hypothetical protein
LVARLAGPFGATTFFCHNEIQHDFIEIGWQCQGDDVFLNAVNSYSNSDSTVGCNLETPGINTDQTKTIKYWHFLQPPSTDRLSLCKNKKTKRKRKEKIAMSCQRLYQIG